MFKKGNDMRLSIGTCARLIWRDMAVFWPTFPGRLLNGAIWSGVTTCIFQYIGFGDVSMNLGLFMACANAVSWGFFEVMENVSRLIADIQGERSITYALTLPLPQWMVFVRIALSNALQAMAIAVFLLPMAKLLLWNHFNFASVSFVRVGIIFVLIHLFYGFFSLWLASLVKNLESIGNIWMRVTYPLWFLGGYQFTWATFATKNAILAYLDLINPLVYCFEGMRAAVLGAEGYLPFWCCCGALVFFTVLTGIFGISRMTKRLDCLLTK
jgi:ABC-type polysaccharide/polyol phosphate export permease